MKIVILTGSPRRKGTSALLADMFMEGAREKGHEVTRFDAAFTEVGGCLACGYCREHDGACARQDGMQEVYAPLLAADLVVFVTPLYYFDMSAQLKNVVDRFYAVNKTLADHPKQAMLLATGNSVKDWAMDALKLHYQTILRHLGWTDRGMLLAQGVGTREAIEATDYPEQAKAMGMSL